MRTDSLLKTVAGNPLTTLCVAMAPALLIWRYGFAPVGTLYVGVVFAWCLLLMATGFYWGYLIEGQKNEQLKSAQREEFEVASASLGASPLHDVDIAKILDVSVACQILGADLRDRKGRFRHRRCGFFDTEDVMDLDIEFAATSEELSLVIATVHYLRDERRSDTYLIGQVSHDAATRLPPIPTPNEGDLPGRLKVHTMSAASAGVLDGVVFWVRGFEMDRAKPAVSGSFLKKIEAHLSAFFDPDETVKFTAHDLIAAFHQAADAKA